MPQVLSGLHTGDRQNGAKSRALFFAPGPQGLHFVLQLRRFALLGGRKTGKDGNLRRRRIPTDRRSARQSSQLFNNAGETGSVGSFQRGIGTHFHQRPIQQRGPVAGLALCPRQQRPAEDRFAPILRQFGPVCPLLIQPQLRVGVALNPAMELQHQLLQPSVIPAEAEAVGQLHLPGGHIRVKILQNPGQHPLTQQLRLPLVQHPEVRCQSALISQVKQVDVLPQQCCTESVDGFDVRLIYQQQLALEMAVAGTARHAATQLLCNALPQLGGGGLGEGDDEKVVQIRPLLPQHPAEQSLHQHLRLPAACRGGYQHPSAPVLHRSALAVCQLDTHAAASSPTTVLICPQNSSGLTGRRGLCRSPPAPSVKLQAEAKAQ